MAGQTTNINLAKPTYSEDADIAVINSNMDIIDGKMGAVGNTSVQAQINTLNTNTNRREVQKAVYSQLNDNGNPTTNTLTAYPTTAGLFRVGTKSGCPGLPADSNGYGPLLIFNAGGYVLHVHKAANARMWYGTTENVISAPSNWIEIAQNDKISTNDLGSIASMADLKSALNTLATSIGSGVGTFSFAPTFTDNDAGFFNATYGQRVGTIYVRDATHFSCVITYNGGINTTMSNREGTWVIDQFALNSKIKKFEAATTVTDLNEISESGLYYASDTTLNRPANWCIVQHYQQAYNTATQTAQCVGYNRFFFRRKSANVWSEWQELALKSEVDAEKTIFVQLNNQTIAGSASSAETTTFDLSSHIPSGYSIWSAEVQIRDGASFYNLPWIHPNIVQATWIDRITNTSVIIKNKADWSGDRSVTFTLHCKRN